MSERGDAWNEALRRFAQGRDQRLAIIRDAYLRGGPDERKAFRDWVALVVQAGAAPRGETGLAASIALRVEVPFADRSNVVMAEPEVLARALAAWDTGAPFVPPDRVPAGE